MAICKMFRGILTGDRMDPYTHFLASHRLAVTAGEGRTSLAAMLAPPLQFGALMLGSWPKHATKIASSE